MVPWRARLLVHHSHHGSVHLNQIGFATNLVESFSRQTCDKTNMATSYQLDIPIDSITPSFDHCKEAYQSLIGSIGWLSSTTHPNLVSSHSFLSSYTHKPSSSHMKVALYALHCIHSTHDFGISFTSDNIAPMHFYVHFPPSTDIKAYNDAVPPKLCC
jgi:hypothetical protein